MVPRSPESIGNITINLSVKVNKSMPHNILVKIPHTIFPISHKFPNCRQFLFVSIVMFFPTFSVLVANPKKLLYTAADPARCGCLLNREKRTE